MRTVIRTGLIRSAHAPYFRMLATGNILVVDDDDSLRHLLCRTLGENYVAHGAADAASAFAILEKIGVPDLIVCDVMMPGMDGLDFVKIVHADSRYKRVPVVFLTARTSAMDVVAGINAGARSYIAKPFKIAALVARIDKILGASIRS